MSSTVIYIAACLVSMFISFSIALVAWQRRSEPGAFPYSIVAAGQTSWTFGLILETLGPTLEEKIFWDNFQFLGWMLASTMVVIFARELSQQRKNIKPAWWVFAVAVTIGVVVLAYTDPLHKLIRPTTSLAAEFGFTALSYSFTPVMYGLSAYSYVVVLVAAGMLISYLRSLPHEQRPQAGLILTGLLFPVFVGLLSFTSIIPAYLRDINPFTFGLGNLLIAIGLMRYQLFEVSRSAKEQVISTMETAVIAIDTRGHISFLNPVAMKRFGIGVEQFGKKAPAFVQNWFEQAQKEIESAATGQIIHYKEEGKDTSYVSNMVSLINNRGRIIGKSLILNDITLRLRTEQQLSERTRLLEEQTQLIQKNTQALEESNQRALSRSSQFQALAEVSRAIASINELDILLPAVTRVISEHFGFYHAGVFLLDEANEYAVFRGANSPGGQNMLKRGHKLKVGKGIVGNVVFSGTPRIALDTEADAAFLQNPDLPNTRSEMALPLRVSGRIIGALDVQSTEPQAFSEDDVEILSILADQVGIAIQNASLFDEAKRAVAENQILLQQYAREQWSSLLKSRKRIGYRYSGKVEELKEKVETPTPATAEIPISIRGQVIGTVAIHSAGEQGFSQDELDIIRAATERASIAAENARLLEQTTERAERERKVSDITSKIRSTNDPSEMIQIAINELKQTLGVKDARILPYQPAQGKKG